MDHPDINVSNFIEISLVLKGLNRFAFIYNLIRVFQCVMSPLKSMSFDICFQKIKTFNSAAVISFCVVWVNIIIGESFQGHS